MIASYVNQRYNNLYKAYGAYNNTLGSTLAGKLRRMSLMLEHITIKNS